MNLKSNNKAPLLPVSLTTWIILSASFLLTVFAIWTAFLSNSTFDQKIFDCIDPHKTDGRTRFVQLITWGGNTFFLIAVNVLLLLFFIFKKNKWWAIRVATISITSVGLMSLLKNIIHRVRPTGGMVEGITNFSFPSGHAFMSVAFYGLLIWFASVYISNKWPRRLVIAFLLLVIASIGFSRIYLRVHYATDVIAGICIGFVWLDFCLWFIDKKEAAITLK